MATLIKILDKTKFQDKTVFAESAGEGGGSSLTTGLQAFYKLDDESDSSGNGNTLTNNGSVSFASGKLGNAAIIDETNYLASTISLNGTNDWTVSFWVYLNTNTNSEQLITIANAFDIYVTNQGEPGIVINNAVEDNQSAKRVVNTGTWYHYVVRFTDGQTTTFLNNVSDVPATQQNFGSGNIFNIGAYDGQHMYGNKILDAVGIWNRALSDSEVAALYNSGAGIELP